MSGMVALVLTPKIKHGFDMFDIRLHECESMVYWNCLKICFLESDKLSGTIVSRLFHSITDPVMPYHPGVVRNPTVHQLDWLFTG